MPKGKLQPNIERQRHFHAYEVWRDLGHRRSFRETARLVNSTPTSVCKWAKTWDWIGRLAKHTAIVATKEEAGDMIKVDDPVARKMATAMDRIEAIIGSVFVMDLATGKLKPTINVKNMEELTKLLAEYRKFLEAYHKFTAEFRPDKKDKERGTHIKEFNVIMGDMSQEDRIKMMKEIKDGNEPRDNNQPAGRSQEANYTDVSEQGDEDGQGCSGVPGSVTGGSGGDKETLRES